jgi:hypothetical protein
MVHRVMFWSAAMIVAAGVAFAVTVPGALERPETVEEAPAETSEVPDTETVGDEADAAQDVAAAEASEPDSSPLGEGSPAFAESDRVDEMPRDDGDAGLRLAQGLLEAESADAPSADPDGQPGEADTAVLARDLAESGTDAVEAETPLTGAQAPQEEAGQPSAGVTLQAEPGGVDAGDGPLALGSDTILEAPSGSFPAPQAPGGPSPGSDGADGASGPLTSPGGGTLPTSPGGQQAPPGQLDELVLADLPFDAGCGLVLTPMGENAVLFASGVSLDPMQAPGAISLDGEVVSLQRAGIDGEPIGYSQFERQLFQDESETVMVMVEIALQEEGTGDRARVSQGEATVVINQRPVAQLEVGGRAGC